MAEYIVEARLSDLFGIKNKGELVRCKDCKYYDFGLCDNVPKNTSPRPREGTFFCADGKQRGRT